MYLQLKIISYSILSTSQLLSLHALLLLTLEQDQYGLTLVNQEVVTSYVDQFSACHIKLFYQKLHVSLYH